MIEVPLAKVENARPPLYRRAGVRKLVVVVAVIAACAGGWKLLREATRSETYKQLEARQNEARALIGDGLDELFASQLDHETKIIDLVAKLDVDAALGSGYDAFDCGRGFRDAFAEALGPDLIELSTYASHADPALRLEIVGKITPSGTAFQLPNSPTAYPGIALSVDMKLVGKQVHADVEPPADIKFDRVTYGISFEGPSAADVAGGILQGACKQAGYVLLEQLTTWRRPAPAPPLDPMELCSRGFQCRENADALADSDPATAANLYTRACEHDDEDACLGLAELTLRGATDGKERIRAGMTLEMACSREVARACAAAGQVRLIPAEPGKPAQPWQRSEALLLYLRACDLGARDACTAAVPLVKDTPFAEAAPLLGGAPSVASKTMGTLFALRWGQWTKHDRGQPTLWVTRRPTKLSENAIVRAFPLDQLPKAIVPPPGVETVYAVALTGGRRGAEACHRCNPSGGGGSIYSMRSFDCVCALSPR